MSLEKGLVDAARELESLGREKENLLTLFQKGYISESELDAKMEPVIAKRSELEDEREKMNKALSSKDEVRSNIDKAVNYLQDQLDLIDAYQRHPEDENVLKAVKEALGALDEFYDAQDVEHTVNRLKRRIIRQFIDPEKGILIFNDDKILIHATTGEVLESDTKNNQVQ